MHPNVTLKVHCMFCCYLSVMIQLFMLIEECVKTAIEVLENCRP
jgi:hypothetical protein